MMLCRNGLFTRRHYDFAASWLRARHAPRHAIEAFAEMFAAADTCAGHFNRDLFFKAAGKEPE